MDSIHMFDHVKVFHLFGIGLCPIITADLREQ